MWWNDRPRHAKVIGLIPDPCTQHVEVSLSKILNLKWLLELHFNEGWEKACFSCLAHMKTVQYF